MYVELFGQASSGKTTMIKQLKNDYPHIFTRQKLCKTEYNLVFHFPIWFTFKLIIFSLKYKVSSSFFLECLIVHYYFYNKLKDKIHVTDHGFLQTLIGNTKLLKKILKNKSVLTDYFNMLPPGEYVLLDTSTSKCLKREAKRQKLHKTFKWSNKRILEHYKLFNSIISLIKRSNFKIHTIKEYNELKDIIKTKN